MSISVLYQTSVTVNETIEDNVPAVVSSKAVIVHDAFNTTQTVDASSTVPATKSALFSQALSAGTATIDLTSLTGTNGISVDGTGLKVQIFKFKNPAGNASMKVDVGASNGYELAGAGFEATILAGQEICFFGNESSPDIGASDKTLDITGTGTEEVEVSIVMG